MTHLFTREECPSGAHNYPSSCTLCGYSCTCTETPREYHHVHFGITEPGSAIQQEPDCPEHGEIPEQFRQQVKRAQARAAEIERLETYAIRNGAAIGVARQIATLALENSERYGADAEGYINSVVAWDPDHKRRAQHYRPTQPRRRRLLDKLRQATRRNA